jgi:Protein of unknown function (DUF3309)
MERNVLAYRRAFEFVQGKGEATMLLLILLIILLLGVAPAWPYSRGWGYYPSGGVGLILLIFVILILLGYFHF